MDSKPKVSRARKDRGMRTQLVTAEHFAKHGWAHAQSTGSGRGGVDIIGVPGLAIEVKARSTLNPLEWVRQAEKSAGDHGLPFVVFRPNGMGEGDPGRFLAFLRLEDLITLLQDAGYGDGRRLEGDVGPAQPGGEVCGHGG